jgi:hypothetical protein
MRAVLLELQKEDAPGSARVRVGNVALSEAQKESAIPRSEEDEDGVAAPPERRSDA